MGLIGLAEVIPYFATALFAGYAVDHYSRRLFGVLASVMVGLNALTLGAALRLPTFEFDGVTLYKRVTLVVEACAIAKVFYPVFPPDKNAETVLAWLKRG